MRIYGLLSVLPDSPYGEGHGGSWADVTDRHSGHCTREAGNFFPVAVYRVRVWGISVRDIPLEAHGGIVQKRSLIMGPAET